MNRDELEAAWSGFRKDTAGVPLSLMTASEVFILGCHAGYSQGVRDGREEAAVLADMSPDGMVLHNYKLSLAIRALNDEVKE